MKAKHFIHKKFALNGKSNKTIWKKKNRHFLLLEVMISFAIVALCILPLLAPNAWMINEEKRFVQDLEKERYVALIRTHLLKQLYLHLIPWSHIENPNFWEVQDVEELPKNWPFTIQASIAYKDKEGEESDYYLLNLTIRLTEKRTTPPAVDHYRYLIFMEKKNEKQLPPQSATKDAIQERREQENP